MEPNIDAIILVALKFHPDQLSYLLHHLVIVSCRSAQAYERDVNCVWIHSEAYEKTTQPIYNKNRLCRKNEGIGHSTPPMLERAQEFHNQVNMYMRTQP